MRVTIPKFENKKLLYSYLKENKKSIISQKKSTPIVSDSCSFGVSKVKTGIETKANEAVAEDVDKIRVKVVANTANWVDSHMDMLLPDSAAKSIRERKAMIPHLHDHVHELGAKIGEVIDIYNSTMSYSELGIDGDGSTQALVFITDVMKSYNEKVFNQYKLGRVNQHSIGLQYLQLELAINDEDSEKEFDFWNKYYTQVINKEVADDNGFFWVIQEIRLIENSAVLFGANPITPTLENNVKKPEKSTSKNKQPSDDTEKRKFLLNLLKN